MTRRAFRAAVASLAATALVVTGALAWRQMDRSRPPDTLAVRLGTGIVRASVAKAPEARSKGLQDRSSLPDSQGMLFVYDPPATPSFALKSVPFSLDVVFVAPDLRVIAVAPLDTAHRLASSPAPVAYVLEVNGGWAARHGVQAGTSVAIPAR